MLDGNNASKLVIVCTKETEKYGKYLMQLISLKNDEKDTIAGRMNVPLEAILLNEKDYEANRKTLSSSTYVLFIGSSRRMQEENANMLNQFNKYGMHFAQLGLKAVMYVDKNSIQKREEYDEFHSFCSKYGKNLEETAKLHFQSGSVTLSLAALVLVAPLTIAPIVAAPALLYQLAFGRGTQRKIFDQQYQFLTFYSYIEMLPGLLND